MKVEVTAEDMTYGLRRACRRCPVALALTRALNFPVIVGRKDFLSDVDGRGWTLPLHVQGWIEAFDDGAEVAPFSFEVHI